MNSSLDNRRFLFITGKGGVGKTTVTAALALRLAAKGKRVLCAMCQAKERLSTLLDGPAVGEEISQLRENIWAVNMNPDAALSEYGLMVLRVRAIYKAVFENQVVRAFFRATPGLNEWAMLGKAWFHTTELLPNGAPRFDVVLLDAPATGHGLDMLRGPKVILDIAPPGLLRREAVRAWKLFSDPKLAGIVVVTLPEDMPVSESLELLSSIQNDLKLPVARIIVNQFLPPLFSPEERKELLSPQILDLNSPGDLSLACGARRSRREIIQSDALSRLRESTASPITFLPHLFDEVANLDSVQELAKRI